MNLDIITINNFYTNPDDVRRDALSLPFSKEGNYPGIRTEPYINSSIQNVIQDIIFPYGGKISNFSEDVNGSFQITYAWEKSWIHADTNNTWAGLCYLTPDAPPSSGTGFYKHRESGITNTRQNEKKAKEVESQGQEYFRWELVQKVSNEYNKLVLYDGQLFHKSLDYFGDNLKNGRLTQVFFFDTE